MWGRCRGLRAEAEGPAPELYLHDGRDAQRRRAAVRPAAHSRQAGHYERGGGPAGLPLDVDVALSAGTPHSPAPARCAVTSMTLLDER